MQPSKTPSNTSWLRQALTGPDNQTFEWSYLIIGFVAIQVAVVIVSMVALGIIDVWHNENPYNPSGLGAGIAAVIASLGGFLGGLAATIAMDRKRPPTEDK